MLASERTLMKDERWDDQVAEVLQPSQVGTDQRRCSIPLFTHYSTVDSGCVIH